MDSPLNRAHQWARKADTLAAAGQFDEAIMCHNRAAENMLETLQAPILYDNASLVSCLRQQHEHHLRQVKVLQNKQRQHSNKEARNNRPVTMRNKATQTETLKIIPLRGTGIRHENVLVNTQNIEESIRGADTMLRFLKQRKEDPETELPWQQSHDDDETELTEAGTDVAFLATKKPKDDKVIIEELRCLTGELQIHIKQLVQESEWLKVENQRLSTKDQQSDSQEESVNELIPLTSHFSNSSSFNLPPLEMPLLQQPPKLSSDSEDEMN